MKPALFRRILTDCLMTLTLLFLMACELIGTLPHELLGTAMLLLFLIHHILNRAWIRNLFKGRYSPARVIQTALVLLILAAMLGSMASGVVLSRHLFAALPIQGGRSIARTAHMLCGYWGFVLMSLHLGLHWNVISGAVRQIRGGSPVSRPIALALRGAAALMVLYGVWAFFFQNLGSYLLLRTQFVFFDFERPIALFLLDYLCVCGENSGTPARRICPMAGIQPLFGFYLKRRPFMNFQYHNLIRFVFGPDALDQLPELCRNRKVLLVYGGGSIKDNGVYERITGHLKDSAAGVVEYGGHRSAAWQSILDGIALARREKVDAVIEVGGASAMDTGKAIAFGAVHENQEDYIEGRASSDGRHLFNIVIPTYPATGSEANGVCDIMEYKGHGTELFGAWPDVCLMDPSATLSLDRLSTAYSVWTYFIQTSAWFIGNHQNEIAKGFARTVLQTLLKSYETLLSDPKDLRAGEQVMWASCVNTMGVFRSGVDNFYPWTLFSVGYIPWVAHGASYREALAAESGQFIRLHSSVKMRFAHWRACGPPDEK